MAVSRRRMDSSISFNEGGAPDIRFLLFQGRTLKLTLSIWQWVVLADGDKRDWASHLVPGEKILIVQRGLSTRHGICQRGVSGLQATLPPVVLSSMHSYL